MYYLRFTQNIESDIQSGVSYLKTPSMKKAKKLNGLCAFSFDPYNEEGKLMSNEEIEEKIRKISNSQYYLNTEVAVLLEGKYVGSNPNGEGVLIKVTNIVKEFYL